MEAAGSLLWRYREALLGGLVTTIELSLLGIIGSTLTRCRRRRLRGDLGVAAAPPRAHLYRNRPQRPQYRQGVLPLLRGRARRLPRRHSSRLTIHQSADIADVIGAGLRGIPREQAESAHVLGPHFSQTFFHVLLPQLVRAVIPR